MGRSPCCSKEGLNRGAWTAAEDEILREYIKVHGEGSWRNLPKRAGLKRCGKSCRLRWLNYLRPDIKRGNITQDEEELIIRLHKLLGNRWSLIAGRLPGRTDNEIKNYWNTNLGKRVRAKSSAQGSSTTHVEKKCLLEKSTVLLAKYDNSAANIVVPPTIRTKASRCTKVMVAPPQKFGEEIICTSGSTSLQPDLVLEEEDDDNNKEGPQERSEMDALIFEHDINPQEGSNFSTSLDFDDINDLGLSDLLDFNFSSPSSTHPPLIFEQETGVLAGNWNTGNCSCCMELHDSASDETQTSLDALIP